MKYNNIISHLITRRDFTRNTFGIESIMTTDHI